MGAERTFSVMADSISTFAGCNPDGYAVFFDEERAARSGLDGPGETWWARVIAHVGGRLLANASYSGSMMAGAGFPAGACMRRARDLAPAGDRPTDVLVFLGTNDYGWGSARAQAAGRSSATPPATDLASIPPQVAGRATEEDLDAFAQAYGQALEHVRQVAPEAHVWCLSLVAGRLAGVAGPTFCWNLRGVPMARYNEAIRKAAESHGATFVDAAGYGLDYEAVDGTHPTARGMRQLAALVTAAMEHQAPDGPALAQGYPDQEGGRAAWASRDLCGSRPCVGCPDARSTGNDWSCVCERAVRQARAAADERAR